MRSVLATATGAIEKYAEEIESGSCVADFGVRCDAIYTEALETFSNKAPAAGGDASLAAVFDTKVWLEARGNEETREHHRRPAKLWFKPASLRIDVPRHANPRRYSPPLLSPQVESLEKSIDAPIRVLYMKQLLLLRDKVRC